MKLIKLFTVLVLMFPLAMLASSTSPSEDYHLVLVSQELKIEESNSLEVKQNWKTRVLSKVLYRKVQKQIKKSEKPNQKTNYDERKTGTKGLISFFSGIGSWLLPILLNGAGILLIVLSIAAIILGIMGIKEVRDNENLKGEGWAIAGLSIGGANILIVLIALVLIVALIGSSV